ncbi:NmrA/HSCARG family protein [Dyella monticola]|uniref:NmrA/HSCARG family protein n=1 Tax=Dyella monticola TaxID=1927958 RepID=A0A370WYL9_9GAMM|nr:NmrA/HSCARG family protein [Dyella monticola]RDS81120.1 NmrA/HSCARG family protein [Dyella monticola]
MSKNSGRTILITGATGRQGGAVYRHLQKKGFTLRALVRDPESDQARQLMGNGQAVVQGSFDDSDSLMRAMDGVYGVFSAQPYTAREIEQGAAVIDAAKRQGVSHFVYSSVGSADEETGIPHFESKIEVEAHLRSSGLPYTIVRPVFFMENWQKNLFGESIRNGQLQQPLSPTTHLQMVAVDDIGAFAALAFEHPDTWKNRTFSLAGDELSMQQIADAFSRVTAQDVKYAQVPWSQFEKNAGRELTVMYHWFEEKGFHFDIEEARRECPQTHTFNQWLDVYWDTTSGE